jgi:hypothetical protein
MRMVSGDEARGGVAQSSEEPLVLPGLPGSLETGGRWLLHLNDALYAHGAFVHGGESAARGGGRWYVQTLAPAPVLGDEVRPLVPDQEPVPLPELRETLRPLRTALVAGGLIAGNVR